MADKLARVNFNVTNKQKQELAKLAKKQGLNLTDYIIKQCFDTDPSPEINTLREKLETVERELSTKFEYQITLKDQEIRHLSEKLSKAEHDLEKLEQDHTELKQRYNISQNALLWHSLPWYKKMGKRLELPYNDK